MTKIIRGDTNVNTGCAVGKLYKTNIAFMTIGTDTLIKGEEIVMYCGTTYIKLYQSYISTLICSKGIFKIRHISKTYVSSYLDLI